MRYAILALLLTVSGWGAEPVFLSSSPSKMPGSGGDLVLTYNTALTSLIPSKILVSGATRGTPTIGTGINANTLNIPLSALTADVLVTVDIGAIADAASNTATTISKPVTVTRDITPPSVTITTVGSVINTTTGAFTITLDEPATIDPIKFTIVGATIGTPTGSGANWTVNFTGANKDIVLTLAAGAFTDFYTNSTTTVYTQTIKFDNVGPTFTTSPLNGTTVRSLSSVTLTFNESATISDLTKLKVTGALFGTLSGGGTTYSLPITPNQQAPIVITADPGTFTDALGNPNVSITSTITYDSKAPTFVSANPLFFQPTLNGKTLTVTFDSAYDFIDTSKITADGAILNFTDLNTSNSANSVTLKFTSNSKDTVVITLGNGAFSDKAGNGNPQQSITLIKDPVRPTVQIPSDVWTNTTTVDITVTLSKNCPTVDNNKITGTAAGITIAAPASKDANINTTYVIKVSDLSQEGDSTLTIAAGAFTDIAGNSTADPSTITIHYDKTAPTLKLQTPTLVDLAANATVNGTYIILYTGTDIFNSLDTTKITISPDTVKLGTPINRPDANNKKSKIWQLPLTTGSTTSTAVKITLGASIVIDQATNANIAYDELTFNLVNDSTTAKVESSWPMGVNANNIGDSINIPLQVIWSKPLTNIIDKSKIQLVGSGTIDPSTINIDSTNNKQLNLTIAGATDQVTVSFASGALTDTSGNPSVAKDLTLPYDTDKPTIVQVSSANDTKTSFKKDDTVLLNIRFSESIRVAKDFTLTLATASNKTGIATLIIPANNDYIIGENIKFQYKVESGDNTAHLDYSSSSALSCPAASSVPTSLSRVITDLSGKPLAPYVDGDVASNTLPPSGDPGGLYVATTLQLDSVAPTVTGVTSDKTDGTYFTGDTLMLQVMFSEPLILLQGSATPTLTLQLNGGKTDAAFTSLSAGKDALSNSISIMNFSYTVASGDSTSDLNYVDINSLKLGVATITDKAGNPWNNTLPDPSKAGSLGFTKQLEISNSPVIRRVVADPKSDNKSFGKGQTITLFVEYSEALKVTGFPQLPLKLTASGNRYATFVDNTADPKRLKFTYTIQADDGTSDLEYNGSQLIIPSGTTLKNASETADAKPTLLDPSKDTGKNVSLGNNANIIVDTTAPTITNVNAISPNKVYAINDIITLAVNFSKPIVITGTPTFNLDLNFPKIGGVDVKRPAAFSSLSSDKKQALFTYTVKPGDRNSDLNYFPNEALVNADATPLAITDVAGNPMASLLLPTSAGTASLGSTSAIGVVGTQPAITKVTAVPGIYVTGDNIQIQVTMTSPVTVQGIPLLRLNTSPSRDAKFVSSSGNLLNFSYSVQTGDSAHPLDCDSASPIILPSSPATSITDTNYSNPANLTMLPTDDANSLAKTSLVIVRKTSDGKAPLIESITGPGGTYATNTNIDITVTFDQEVRVAGTPKLLLNSNPGAPPSALYLRGSGTKVLTFRYTVGANDKISDLDYNSTSDLILETGAGIDDGYLNANLALPAPGSPKSLGGSSAIVINTTVVVDPGKPAVVDGNSSGGGGCGMGGGVAILGSLSAWAWRRRQRRAA